MGHEPDDFDGVLVSGTVGLVKPDPAIFELFVKEHAVDVRHAVFVDDSATNVAAGAAAGFDSVQFTSPEPLRHDLAMRGLLEGPVDPPHVE